MRRNSITASRDLRDFSEFVNICIPLITGNAQEATAEKQLQPRVHTRQCINGQREVTSDTKTQNAQETTAKEQLQQRVHT